MEQLSAEQFAAVPTLSAWEVRGHVAVCRFATGDFATGVRLLDEIARIADALGHHPEVTIRFGSVEVATTTYETGGLTDRDVALARAITELARRLGLTPRDA